MPETSDHIISGSSVTRNTLFNLIGESLPLLVALFAIPLLIEGLGLPRFGILTISWMIVGYFSLFDFGLGRAMTKLVAEKLGTADEPKIPGIVWTSLVLMFLLGMLGVIVLLPFLRLIVYSWLKIPENLQAESFQAFYLLTLSIPIIITSVGLRGVLEAKQCFGLVNIIRIPLGVYSFLGPLIVVYFTQSLVVIIIVLIIGRVLGWIANLFVCFHVLPALSRSFVFQRKTIKPLFFFGGWMTVSNLISPIMVYMDRLFIGSIVSVTAVAFYTTPFEIVTKLLIIPRALGCVLFPAIATFYIHDKDFAAALYIRVVKYMFSIMFFLVLLLIALAYEGLALWLGEEFAMKSTFVAQCLAIGVLINSLGQIPFTCLQSIGRPDMTAKMHMLELPLYLVFLWKMIVCFGIEGAAVAWVVRVIVDSAGLFLMVHFIGGFRTKGFSKVIAALCMVLIAVSLAVWLDSFVVKICFLSLALTSSMTLTWRYFMVEDDRLEVRRYVKGLRFAR